MSIRFRIATHNDDGAFRHATITARQLAAFRQLLREQGDRLGIVLLDPENGQDHFLSYQFDARICPIALATICALFDHDPDVVAVMEEAQYRQRRVTIYPGLHSRDIRVRVSMTSDAGLELYLASADAHALLAGLGLSPDDVGEIGIAPIRERLAHPAVRRRCLETGVAANAERLIHLLALADRDETARLEWA